MNAKHRSTIFDPRFSVGWLLSSLLFIATAVTPASAQSLNSSTQPEVLRDIGIDQNLDEQIPLDLVFRDETGRAVQLSEYFDKKPVILSLVYYECPMLCTQVLNGLLKSLNTLSFDVGNEFTVLTISFDPGETPDMAVQKKKVYLNQYDRPGAEEGWHFLTGDESAIKRLTEAVGFRYAYDAKIDQFIHASGIMIVTPQGKLARYFYGIEYSARDMRLGLIEAAENKIGSPVDQVLLYCLHYDPTSGKYGVAIMNVIRLAGLATVLVLGGFMLVMLRRDRREKRGNSRFQF